MWLTIVNFISLLIYTNHMKNKILSIAFFIFYLTTMLFPHSPAIVNLSFVTEETEKIYHKPNNILDNQLSERATIIGQVKASITCIPTPLMEARVHAIRMIPFGRFFSHYEGITNSEGKYQLEVTAGFYRVFVRKDGFLQSTPLLFHLIKGESGQIYNCSFIVRPRVFPMS
jgi:hypothetical protein